MDVVCVCVCLSSELFQLVAVHLPRSGDQEVEARELSAVLCDVSPSGAASFGRGVRVVGLPGTSVANKSLAANNLRLGHLS